MGEEVQKPEESKKPDEAKKAEEPKPDGGAGEKKEESKESPPPPPPPQEIVLRVFMHCEGCARKVRRCLKTFNGVEDVQTDCKTHKVIVKGEKADPLKVLERIQKKSHRKVELLSPVPQPPADDPPPEVKEAPKPEEKTEPPAQVITVVLKVNMHCEACAQEIRKRISKMKGVESAEADLKSSHVTVKGTFESQQLVDYVYKRTAKHAIIVKQDPEPKKDEADKGKIENDDKKVAGAGEDGGEKKEEKKTGETGGDGGGGEGKEKKEGGEEAEKPAAVAVDGGGGGEEVNVVELRKNEFYYYHPHNYQVYPPAYVAEPAYAYPPAPEMFSDENPNACSVM